MRPSPQMVGSPRASTPHAFLVLPEPGSRQFATMARKVRLLAARALLTAEFATTLRPINAAALAGVQPALAAILQRAPDQFLAAIGSPDVLPFLLGAIDGSLPADDALRAAVPNLLAELGLAGAAIQNLVWPLPFDRLVTREGMWSFPSPARSLAVTALEISIEDQRGNLRRLDRKNGEQVRLPVAESMHFALYDTNPLALREEHPEKSGNALDLAGRSAQEWLGTLKEALALIEAGIASWYAELSVALQRIVPVGFDAERHLSASYRQAPGVIYVSLHPDPLTMAEAIVHETQHTKVNSLTWFDPVLLNGQSHWTKSQVRPDLRPLMGVLLAVHALVPVAAMHYGLDAADHPISRSKRFQARRNDVLATNAAGLATLQKEAEPTEAGASLIRSLSELHRFLSAAM